MVEIAAAQGCVSNSARFSAAIAVTRCRQGKYREDGFRSYRTWEDP